MEIVYHGIPQVLQRIQLSGFTQNKGTFQCVFVFYQLRTADTMLKSVKSNKKPMKDILFWLAAVYGFCCSMLKGRIFRNKGRISKTTSINIIFQQSGIITQVWYHFNHELDQSKLNELPLPSYPACPARPVWPTVDCLRMKSPIFQFLSALTSAQLCH